jgi:protein tyrosine/serine phosphatase
MNPLPLLIVLIAFATACTAPASAETVTLHAKRQTSWAAPIALDGAPNLHRVAANFYRSAQPNETGFRALKTSYGVRTVINLRDFHSDEPLAAGLGLNLSKIGMHAWHIEREDLAKALHDVRAGLQRGSVLVHCQHGADRTGVVVALYRIVYQGWSKEAAIDEMQHGDFGYHDMWINIPAFVRSVDINRLKQDIAALKE